MKKTGSTRTSTTNRTPPAERVLPKFETSVEGSGTLARVDVTRMATYWSEVRADDTTNAD